MRWRPEARNFLSLLNPFIDWTMIDTLASLGQTRICAHFKSILEEEFITMHHCYFDQAFLHKLTYTKKCVSTLNCICNQLSVSSLQIVLYIKCHSEAYTCSVDITARAFAIT